ncbi:hypothetical protein PISMIDRAFT_88326 [Pisolithus microcarpus 441]|uniref:Transposase family Tnp2 protein n=1 Tax=Pisolithus microcarpus 441 TaxID=765257 RepID=A0A0D0ACI8_9AGAM|nr:hypothetical protein PISMIDRAFT_88326 [Pisolithus microcarpus 441]
MYSDESGLDIRYPIDPTEGNEGAGEYHDQVHDLEPFFPPPPSPLRSPPPDETNIPSPPPTLLPNRVDMALPEIGYKRRTRPQINIQELSECVILPKLQETMQYIAALASATLNDPVTKLSQTALDRLRNPPCQPLWVDNPGHHHSISTYLATEHASKDAYDKICRSTVRNFPGAHGIDDILSFHNIENLIASLTGVEKVQHDMCPNSCVAFTGPYSDLEQCPLCEASRWNQELLQGTNGRSRIPAKRFTTIPLGPQLQALYRDPIHARQMRYLHERTQQILAELRQSRSISLIDDVVAGWDYLGAVLDGDIKKDDIVIMVSLDGAQLYESKQSDCWIYIWIILNLAPDKRYKKVHVCPGGFIPGPNKPKNIDSFLFVGLHHIAALQHEGLRIWDASEDRIFTSGLYLLFTTADGPGLVCWDGMVGHSGKNGCRVYCPTPSRRKIHGTHYYLALLKPRDSSVPGSDHPDIDVFQLPLSGSGDYAHNLARLISAPSQRQWDIRKTETGITKPPLILGLDPSRSLGVPLCMTTDIMHLAGNLSDLLISLWRGTMECVHTDSKDSWDWAVLRDEEIWTMHGQAVEDAGISIPGSFDRKPRNIADKINTDYKTWEFHVYIFCLAPALLYDILPERYWLNFCKLVRGIQIMSQHTINQRDIIHAHILLCSWGREFELLYYQLRQDRLHFIRPCVHQVLHLVTEAMHKGPPICYAQWTMERTIGNLGQEIRQLSKPYENLAEEGVRRSRVNALLAVMPELDDGIKGHPTGSVDLGEGYVLLRKRDKRPWLPTGEEARTISEFIGRDQPLNHFKRWARLRLPNGQIARSLWREKLKPVTQIRVSRNVKFIYAEQERFGEVQYFARLATDVTEEGADEAWRFEDISLIRLYSPPDETLLKMSSHTLVSSKLSDEFIVTDVKSIKSVVGMIPHRLKHPSGVIEDCFFLLEKPGLDISQLGIPYSVYQDDDQGADIE